MKFIYFSLRAGMLSHATQWNDTHNQRSYNVIIEIELQKRALVSDIGAEGHSNGNARPNSIGAFSERAPDVTTRCVRGKRTHANRSPRTKSCN